MGVARVARDRDGGGYIALEPLKRGELVALAPISPPVRTKRDRQLRRQGARMIVLLDLVVLILSVTFILVAAVAARGFGG